MMVDSWHLWGLFLIQIGLGFLIQSVAGILPATIQVHYCKTGKYFIKLFSLEYLGSYHFLLGGGAVCLRWPVANFSWSPLFIRKKILVPPPFAWGKKIWPPPFGLVKKFWSPPRWKNTPLTQTMEGAVIRLKSECTWGWGKVWLYMNMLIVMKHGKEKGCAEGEKLFWIMCKKIFWGGNALSGKKWDKIRWYVVETSHENKHLVWVGKSTSVNSH